MSAEHVLFVCLNRLNVCFGIVLLSNIQSLNIVIVGAVLAQKILGGGIVPSPPSPFSRSTKPKNLRTSYRPTFEICH